MILADTSAWVEFDRGTGSTVHRRLAGLIADDGPLAVTEPVAMEILSGARDPSRASEFRRLLLRCHWQHFDAAADFDAATTIYRSCRRAGQRRHPALPRRRPRSDRNGGRDRAGRGVAAHLTFLRQPHRSASPLSRCGRTSG
jgi:predicted nucleic acid-binding protein